MTTTEAPPELELACHCAADVEGHAPGEDGCTEGVKPRSIRPFKAGPRQPSDAARGTCPGCGEQRPVKRVEVYGDSPNAVKPLFIAVELSIVEHGTCPGGIPTETAFRPGAEVERFVKAYGEDRIVRKVKR